MQLQEFNKPETPVHQEVWIQVFNRHYKISPCFLVYNGKNKRVGTTHLKKQNDSQNSLYEKSGHPFSF